MFLVGPFHRLCLFCGHHFMLCSVHLSSVTSCPHDCNKLATKVQRRVRFNSVAQSFPTLCNPMNHSTPGLPVHHQLPEFTQTHVHQVSDAIQPSHPLASPSPPAPNPSQHQGLFQRVNTSHEVAKVLEFQPHTSPSNEHPGLVSFRMDWFDLLAVQGTLKSLLQHHSSKSINSLALSFLHSPTLTSIHEEGWDSLLVSLVTDKPA